MEKDKDSFLAALQREILRHNFDTFVDNPPSVAQGRRGCVVPGQTGGQTGRFLILSNLDGAPSTYRSR
jgi:hypothetical protein